VFLLLNNDRTEEGSFFPVLDELLERESGASVSLSEHLLAQRGIRIGGSHDLAEVQALPTD
jgi:hypothetical protein